MPLHRRILATAATLVALLLGIGPRLPLRADEPSPDGFVSLFNGKDLTGWKAPEGDGGHWKVVDGVIDYDAGSEAKAKPGEKDEKSLWSDREYSNYVLRLDWRLKDAPFLNGNIPYILPDGSHAADIHGKELRLALPDADSGVFLRKDGRFQVNIWCWPIGSGELFSVRTDRSYPAGVRAAATPVTRADRPVGEWNSFEITVVGKTVTVALNGKTVIPGVTIPDLPPRGPIAFQHHGGKKDGAWTGPPSLVQFRNIRIKELPPTPIRAMLITGGHDHDAAFYAIFDGCPGLDALPVLASSSAFKSDIRGKYDVVIMYDFSRDLDAASKGHLREFVESGGGVVVLHHALLNYQDWDWWDDEAVGGSYRLTNPSSSVKDDQDIAATPAGDHPITSGIAPFRIRDEAYKNLRMAPGIHPLLTTDNPTSDRNLAWTSPQARYRVAAIQLGHGRSAFAHPSYRALVHNAIQWAAGRLK